MTAVWVDEQYFFFFCLNVTKGGEREDGQRGSGAGREGESLRGKLPLHVNTLTAFTTIRCVRYWSESESRFFFFFSNL